MVDTLLSRYRQGGDSSVSKVAKVEQNLATGTDAAGDPITDPMADMMPLLFSKDLSLVEVVHVAVFIKMELMIFTQYLFQCMLFLTNC